jgi:peptidoglycan/xylan/chitin deacetylase (PgdA/CDA1 family)
VGLPELYDYMAGRRSLPERAIVLTLDDGYLDNWTYVVPLLRRYGFSATVLVTPEFVDPADVLRPTLEDVWAGRMKEADLEVRGFMSWRELAAASADDTLSVQSHALTHTWYPTGPEIVDFHHPGDEYYWLDWNAAPNDKPYYLKNLRRTGVAWGTPVYAHVKSLQAVVYRPDPGEAEYVAARAAEAGGEAFFERADWRDVLERAVADYRSRHGVRGETESATERRARFERELVESKRVIESRLDKPVRHFVWPGGGYCDESLALALSVYDSVTWSGTDRWQLRNRPGEDPRLVTRRGIHYVQAGNERVFTGGRYLSWYLDEYAGRRGARITRQAFKLAAIAALHARVWPGDRSTRVPVIPRARLVGDE